MLLVNHQQLFLEIQHQLFDTLSRQKHPQGSDRWCSNTPLYRAAVISSPCVYKNGNPWFSTFVCVSYLGLGHDVSHDVGGYVHDPGIRAAAHGSRCVISIGIREREAFPAGEIICHSLGIVIQQTRPCLSEQNDKDML